MFDSILSSDTEVLTSLSAGTTFTTIGVALVLGLAIGTGYFVIAKKKRVSHNLAMTRIIMPVIVAVMILLIGSNVARAFSLAGICTLVRFRSLPGDSKDISFIFLAVTSGLAVGMGYVSYAALFTLVVLAAIIVYSLIVSGNNEDMAKVLRITIPEDLNFQDAFDDLFKKYTDGARLDKAKTINLGTLFELTYTIQEKEGINEKEFIDEIRERNGNLNIMLMRLTEEAERL